MASEDDGNKTEDPTPKRQGEAREKGQVAKSREVDHWVMILAGTLALSVLGPKMVSDMKNLLAFYFQSAHELPITNLSIGPMLIKMGIELGIAMAPVLGVLIIAALGAGFLQHGFLVAPDLITPKFSKISPMSGFKRIFSTRGLIEFVKGTIKLALIGTFGYWLLKGDFNELEKLIFIDHIQTLQLALKLAMKLLVGVLALLTIVAALDYGYQKFQMLQDMRMSREEIREEYKQSEGDPIVKGRLRQLRMERARRRMMAAVPRADVVITNPTHFAVALQYDQATMDAPKLVAKGTDLVAHRIRDLAAEHNVPIVENPPVARALYATVDIDREIPPEHYKVVAEIIGYVMKLRKGQMAEPPPPAPEDYKGELPPPN